MMSDVRGPVNSTYAQVFRNSRNEHTEHKDSISPREFEQLREALATDLMAVLPESDANLQALVGWARAASYHEEFGDRLRDLVGRINDKELLQNLQAVAQAVLDTRPKMDGDIGDGPVWIFARDLHVVVMLQLNQVTIAEAKRTARTNNPAVNRPTLPPQK
jgi:hypothetical protein